VTFGAKLVHAWASTLTLSKVTPSETVVLLRGPNSHPDNVQAASLAVSQLGARLLIMELGDTATQAVAAESTAYIGRTALTGNRAAIEAMKCADMVVDMMGMDRGTEQSEILAAGTRILLVKEPPETLMRLVPTMEDKRRVIEATQRLSRAKSMTVRSENGTNLTVKVGEYSCLTQYGFADESGRWDHWPGAFVATWPNERSANGTVVLSPGDVILPFKQYVRTPITLHIEAGYIRKIEGGFDARYLRDYMAMFNDSEGYAVSHLGWGLYPAAHWTTLGMYDKRQTNAMESRSFYGNFMFSTGPNLEGGGTRDTPCHLDIPMLDCSVYVDDEPVVVAGQVVSGN
jgi:2,5-dihydroxypyridine 5,6-dioxygenase